MQAMMCSWNGRGGLLGHATTVQMNVSGGGGGVLRTVERTWEPVWEREMLTMSMTATLPSLTSRRESSSRRMRSGSAVAWPPATWKKYTLVRVVGCSNARVSLERVTIGGASLSTAIPSALGVHSSLPW